MIKNVKKSSTYDEYNEALSSNAYDYFMVELRKKSSTKRLSECMDYIDNNIRTPNTPLTKEEMEYLFADTEVVCAYIRKKLK